MRPGRFRGCRNPHSELDRTVLGGDYSGLVGLVLMVDYGELPSCSDGADVGGNTAWVTDGDTQGDFVAGYVEGIIFGAVVGIGANRDDGRIGVDGDNTREKDERAKKQEGYCPVEHGGFSRPGRPMAWRSSLMGQGVGVGALLQGEHPGGLRLVRTNADLQ